MIYVASSWRNKHQPLLIANLREAGLEVYDFRNPPGRSGFAWSDIDPKWQSWKFHEFFNALCEPSARKGFDEDFGAMKASSSCILCLPAGRSACLEAGWMKGSGKYLSVYWPPDAGEPELMVTMADFITDNIDVLVRQHALIESSVERKIHWPERE